MPKVSRFSALLFWGRSPRKSGTPLSATITFPDERKWTSSFFGQSGFVHLIATDMMKIPQNKCFKLRAIILQSRLSLEQAPQQFETEHHERGSLSQFAEVFICRCNQFKRLSAVRSPLLPRTAPAVATSRHVKCKF